VHLNATPASNLECFFWQHFYSKLVLLSLNFQTFNIKIFSYSFSVTKIRFDFSEFSDHTKGYGSSQCWKCWVYEKITCTY
jgi:hypothetical protein